MTGPWLVRDRDGQGRKAGGLLAPVLPARFGMLKTELGHDLASGVDDDDLMGALRPIKTGEVGDGGFTEGHDGFPVRGSEGGLRSGCLRFSPEST
jgi:hypothetical protein